MYTNTFRIISILLPSCCSTVAAGCLGSKDSNSTNNNLPELFPCQWADGIIPFVFDFYSINSNRLLKMIRQGHELIQNQSCLVFNERNPIAMAASRKNFYYLYYTYTNALESCCFSSIEREFGRRVVLISPGCKEPQEIAHVTLHMLGLMHRDNEPFKFSTVAAVLNLENCHNRSGVTSSVEAATVYSDSE